MKPRVASLFDGAARRPTGLPRGMLLTIGLLSVGTLLMEHGFIVDATITFWVRVLEALLAGA